MSDARGPVLRACGELAPRIPTAAAMKNGRGCKEHSQTANSPSGGCTGDKRSVGASFGRR